MRRSCAKLSSVLEEKISRMFVCCECRCYNNAYFAKVGGISLPEMNYLEVDFLFGVGFELNVAPETFGHYCAILQSEMLCLELEPEPLLPPNAAAPGSAMLCCRSEDDGTSATTSSSSSTQQQQLAA